MSHLSEFMHLYYDQDYSNLKCRYIGREDHIYFTDKDVIKFLYQRKRELKSLMVYSLYCYSKLAYQKVIINFEKHEVKLMRVLMTCNMNNSQDNILNDNPSCNIYDGIAFYCQKYNSNLGLSFAYNHKLWSMFKQFIGKCSPYDLIKYYPTVPWEEVKKKGYFDRSGLQIIALLKIISEERKEKEKLKVEYEKAYYYPGGIGYQEALNDFQGSLARPTASPGDAARGCAPGDAAQGSLASAQGSLASAQGSQ